MAEPPSLDPAPSNEFGRPATQSSEPIARGWFDEPGNRRWNLALFALAHAGAVVLGFEFYFEPEIVATFWPASGLLLGALLVSRVRTWPLVLLIALIAKSVPSVLLYDVDLGTNLLFGLVEAIEGLAGASALRWWFGRGFSLTRLAEVTGLALAAAVASPALSALGGAAIVTGEIGGPEYWQAWQLWWLADGMGVLLVTPLLVLFSRRLPRWLRTLSGWRLVELATLVLIFVVAQLVFGRGSTEAFTAFKVPHTFYAFLLWATIRFPPWIAALCTFLLANLVVWNANHGRGPFVLDQFSAYQTALTIQVYLAVGALSVLALAAVLASRARIAAARRTSDATLRTMLESASDAVLISSDNRYVDCNDKLLVMLKVSKADILGKRPWDIAPPLQEDGADSEAKARELIGRFEKGELSLAEWRLLDGEGGTVDVEASFAGVEVAGEKLRISHLRDITDRKRAEKATRERVRFESLISDLSARFVNLPAHQADRVIEDSLRKICEHLRFDVARLYQIQAGGLDLTHHWMDSAFQAPELFERPQVADGGWAEFPYMAQRILAGERLVIPDTERLPDEASTDRRNLEAQGVKAIIVLALKAGDSVAGGVGFASLAGPRDFSDEIVQRLQLAADILANALARKRADQAVEESEEKFAKAFQASPDVLAIGSLEDRRILDVNQGFVDTTGYSREEAIGRTTAELDLWIDPVGRERLEEALAGEGRSRLKCRMRTKAGRERLGEISAVTIRVGGEKRFLAVLRDVTEQEEARAALKESEEKFFKAFHSSPSPSAITRLSDNRHLDVNDAWVDATGYNRDEALGKTTQQLDLWPTEGESTRLMEDFKSGRSDARIAGRFRRRDGSELFLEVSAVLIEIAGEPCVLSVATDLTERENAYREIARLKDELEQERDYLREEVKSAKKFGDIVGESPVVVEMLDRIHAVATTEATVLIQGESGVGKELVATAIHAQSERRTGPLVRVNCASVPRNLFESEFFGHVRGAFTGAARDRVGRFQLAHRGTLFLDEIAEIPIELQPKLLRALQDGEVQRVGEESSRTVDVRVVAATNRELENRVKEGRFREDLYYRLNVFPIWVPPLRERGDDIILLAKHFSDEISLQLGREPLALSRFQAEKLLEYGWPGNIRELRNVIEKAVILSTGKRLQFDLAAIRNAAAPGAPPGSERPKADAYVSYGELQQRERDNLLAALDAAAWKVSGPGGAAELLGIRPSTLTSKMKKLKIKRASGKPPHA